MICFSGKRNGLTDLQGWENCEKGLKRLMPLAEKHNVVLTMELLNSVGHKDYQCDHTVWGRIMSPCRIAELQTLYDIYHMQIMEGNIIENIRKYHEYFSHIHTGGNPGRAEIDETQELYYPAIMKALVETWYKGFVGQEFVPRQQDKIASWRNVFVFVMSSHMKKTRIIQLCFLLFAVAFAGCKGKSGSEQAGGAFTPGELWPDNNGVHINAHGGGILHDGDTYYWFGEHKTEGTAGNNALVGVHCYSSKDLYNWKDEGVALSVVTDDST